MNFLDSLETLYKCTKYRKNKFLRISSILYTTRLQSLTHIFRSLVQSTQTQFSEDEAEQLVATMMKSAHLENKQELTFEDFQVLLQKHVKDIERTGLHMKGKYGYKIKNILLNM